MTKDTKMFHILVRKNRRQGNDTIMELEVNGKNYIESENIISGFQEHFSSLATFNQKTCIDSTYHNLVEDDSHIINKLVQSNNIKNVTSDEIANAIRSLNKGKSADYHGLMIEHIIYAGSDITGTCFILKIYAPSSSLLQGKYLPFSPSSLRLNIFRLFVILSLTQLYRYSPEIFLFSTATFKHTYRAPLRRIGQEYSANVATSTFQSLKRIHPLPVCAGFFICIRNSLDRPCVTMTSWSSPLKCKVSL